MANVAQLAEPRFVVPVVVGSSPIVRPRLETPSVRQGVFFMGECQISKKLSFYLSVMGLALAPNGCVNRNHNTLRSLGL